MITDIWIENFKGIGKRQHIPLRPITLLFGANSVGKSTVLHALLWLRDILSRRNLNLTAPLEGEGTVSLGGMENLKHHGNSDRSGPISLSVRFSPTNEQIISFRKALEQHFDVDMLSNSPYRKMIPRAPGEIQIDLAIDKIDNEPVVTQFVLRTNDHVFVRLVSKDKRTAVGRVNLLSDCWGNTDNSYGSSAGDKSLGRLVRDYYQIQINRIESFFQVADAVIAEDGKDRQPVLYATRLLECPELKKGISSSRAFDETNSEVMADSGLCIGFERIGLGECLRRIRPIELSVQEEEFVNEPRSNSIFVLLMVVDDRIKEAFPSFPDHFRILGIYGRLDDAELISRSIDRIRSYLFYSESDDSVGPWTCEFTLNEREHNIAVGAVPSQSTRWTLHQSDFRIEVHDDQETFPLIVEERLAGKQHSPTGKYTDQTPGQKRYLNLGCLNLPPNFPGPEYPDEDFVKTLIDATVDCVVRESIRWVSSDLTDLLYVGPKRSTVPRFLSTQNLDPFGHWGNGLAAWAWLLKATDEQVLECSEWLLRLSGSQEQIGYQIIRESFREVPVLSSSAEQSQLKLEELPVVRRISLVHSNSPRKLHPQDVGEGITQVIPVVVALVSNSTGGQSGRIIAIEQPELHLHPAVAAKIGDLAIESTLTTRNSIALIETHSEHLILRILRRIRQTTDDELPGQLPAAKTDDVCVLWVDNLGDGTTYQRLRIDEHGEFIDRWPRGFFSERAEELF
jgi:hypothetical protein